MVGWRNETATWHVRRIWKSCLFHLLNKTQEITVRFAPAVSQFLVDRVGVTMLPGYRALARFMLRGWLRETEPHIDPKFYLDQIQPTARVRAALDPGLHYCLTGWMQGLAPNATFDPAVYRQANRGLHWAADPFLHFVEHRILRENLERSVSPIRSAPSVAQSGWVPQLGPSAIDRRSNRCVVYTAVVGGYDILRSPEFVPKNCDFVVFSDQSFKSEGWKILPLNYDHPDPVRASRHAKLHPHLYFPEYQHSIWLDANIGMRGDISNFLAALSPASPVAAFVHPSGNCIFDEGEGYIRRFSDGDAKIEQQLMRYRAAGCPRSAGLWETSVLARRHHDPACIKLMAEWWREIETGSSLDQISLPVAAGRRSVSIASLDFPGLHARNHSLLTSSPHLTTRVQPGLESPPLPIVRRDVDVDSVSVTIGVWIQSGQERVRQSLGSLPRALGKNMRVLIIDDGSDPETADLLLGFAKRHDHVTIKRYDQSRGRACCVNVALTSEGSDWTIFLDGNTVVPPRALRKLIEAGLQYPRLGVVGPLSNAAGWQSIPQVLGPDGMFAFNELPDGVTIEDLDGMCEEVSKRRVPFVPLVDGSCMAIRQSMLTEVGLWDEDDFPTGHGAAYDFCFRVADNGFASGVATDTYVYRPKPAALMPERRRDFAADGEQILCRRYGIDRVRAAVAVMRSHSGLASIGRQVAYLQTTGVTASKAPRH